MDKWSCVPGQSSKPHHSCYKSSWLIGEDEINYSEFDKNLLMNNWEGAKARDLGGKEMRFDLCPTIYGNCRDLRLLVRPRHNHFKPEICPNLAQAGGGAIAKESRNQAEPSSEEAVIQHSDGRSRLSLKANPLPRILKLPPAQPNVNNVGGNWCLLNDCLEKGSGTGTF